MGNICYHSTSHVVSPVHSVNVRARTARTTASPVPRHTYSVSRTGTQNDKTDGKPAYRHEDSSTRLSSPIYTRQDIRIASETVYTRTILNSNDATYSTSTDRNSGNTSACSDYRTLARHTAHSSISTHHPGQHAICTTRVKSPLQRAVSPSTNESDTSERSIMLLERDSCVSPLQDCSHRTIIGFLQSQGNSGTVTPQPHSTPRRAMHSSPITCVSPLDINVGSRFTSPYRSPPQTLHHGARCSSEPLTAATANQNTATDSLLAHMQRQSELLHAKRNTLLAAASIPPSRRPSYRIVDLTIAA